MGWPIRYKMVALATLGTVINYIDRVNISVAAPDIMRDTGWDEARFGYVFSSFLVGYALLQYPGGVIADRWSARKLLAYSCLGFSAFTALSPLGQHAFLLLLTLRFMVGAFESAAFPSFASFNSKWVPRSEFGRAQTVVVSGASLGQVIAYPTTAWIIHEFNWQSVFYFNAALGVCWVALWLWYSRDTPREHSSVSSAELEEIESGMIPKADLASIPLGAILKAPAVLSLIASYMLFVFCVWIFILWFPTYLMQARGFSLLEMGTVGMFPTAAGFLGIIAGGVISDTLLKRGYSTRTARARVPGAFVGLSIPALLVAVTVSSAALSVAFFVVFYFVVSLSIAGYWSLPLELNPRAVGAISGVMNGSGNMAGIFGPIVAGQIVASTGSWVLPFYLVAVLLALSCLVYVFLITGKQIEIPGLDSTAPRPAID
jgi:sugar phosphate permease